MQGLVPKSPTPTTANKKKAPAARPRLGWDLTDRTIMGARSLHNVLFLDNQRSVKELTLLSRIRPLRFDDIDQALGGGIEKAGGNDCLLCVSNSVPAHDIYSNLRDRDGHLCCNGQDCSPVEATVLAEWQLLPASEQ